MMDAGRHPNITLLTYSEVEDVFGYVGNFNVGIRKRARFVDEDLCTGCGLCQQKCPSKVIDVAYEAGIGERKAIYLPFSQAIPNVPVLDVENCIYFQRDGRCGACAKLCPTGAVDYEQEDELLDVEVGVVIVATGFGMWDPGQLSQYSYGESPNILTGLQFERLSSATGPTEGRIVTAEGEVPERVAIIHCVGSRDENAHPYCSRVCCMYSLKHAHLVRDSTDADVYEFYIDMRTSSKTYEEFYQRVQGEDVTFVRGHGAEIEVLPDRRLRVKGEDADLGWIFAVDVDMVVLASAIEPHQDANRVAALFGLGRTSDGWFAEAHPKLRPVETNVAGVLLAGCCQGPRDIPDTVAHAEAAAHEAVRLLNRGEVTISPMIAVVEEELCSGCKICLSTCPYNAISLVEEDRVARINEALCRGCGTCVASCPAGAITARHFTDEQIVAQIKALFHTPAEPSIR